MKSGVGLVAAAFRDMADRQVRRGEQARRFHHPQCADETLHAHACRFLKAPREGGARLAGNIGQRFGAVALGKISEDMGKHFVQGGIGK